MKRSFFLIIVCISLCGCATAARRATIKELQEKIKQQDREILMLKKQLGESEEKIRTLKDKLSTFGVF